MTPSDHFPNAYHDVCEQVKVKYQSLLAADRESSTERGSPDVRSFTTQEQGVTKSARQQNAFAVMHEEYT
jgi:hypothetical protein